MKTKLFSWIVLMIVFFAVSVSCCAQMKRLPILGGTGIQYSPLADAAKSVVIILPGIGEQGTDPTVIETNIGIAKALKAGTFSVNRIVLFLQIPKTQGGYYANSISPLLAYAQTFKLPIDFSGLSLGGMGVSNNLPTFPGQFRSAMTCPGKVESDKPIDKYGPAISYSAAYNAIPSIHYYDPNDLTIPDGYSSTKRLVDLLQASGKKDITLITLPGKGHDVWDFAYSRDNYWTWLDALDGAIPIPVPIPTIWVNGTNTNIVPPLLNLEVK